MRRWVDPPSGWMYGFPKIHDTDFDNQNISEWLVENGYPQSEIDQLGTSGSMWIRLWEVEEDVAR